MFHDASKEGKYSSQILMLLFLLVLCFVLSAGLTSAMALFGVHVNTTDNMLWLQGVMQVLMFMRQNPYGLCQVKLK